MALDRKDWIEIIGSGMLFAGGIYAFGQFNGRLEQFEKRLEVIEKKGMPGTKIGDLCLKLMDAQLGVFKNGNKATREDVERQLDKLGCYDSVPANATLTAEQSALLDRKVDGNTAGKR